MWQHIVRRLIYAIPVLIGVNLITFALFFCVNTPDDMARMHLGNKHVSSEAVVLWKQSHGYDKPLLYDNASHGMEKLTHTIFYQESKKLFSLSFGQSDQGRDISHDIYQRMWPSLALAVPTLILGMFINVIFAMFLVVFAQTKVDSLGVMFCVILMSVSSLFYIIVGQYLFGQAFKWVPISGYQSGLQSWRFLVLPVVVSLIAGLGSGGRWYRSLLLEQSGKTFVQIARAKGLTQWRVLYRHVLPNAMIPIITGVVVIIPSLFMGSLILESFFGIPGLGSYTIEAIQAQDFAIVRVMVFIGTLLYILGLLLTDVAYVWADPRIRFGQGA